MFGFLIIIVLIVVMALLLPTARPGVTPQAIRGGAGNPKEKSYKDIQEAVYKRFAKLVPKGRMTYEDFCFPREYSVQPQQVFAGEYMAPSRDPKEILIYHKIGAGKTCLAIQIAERWKARGKPLVVMPASLIPGFRSELRSKCAGNAYISASDRDLIRDPHATGYKGVIAKSDEIIDKSYTIISYNQMLGPTTPEPAPLIIVDEVQNINNPGGKYYAAVSRWIESNPRASVVIMSGTPLFDNGSELYGLARLLRAEPKSKEIKPSDVPILFAGKVSYFAGAPAFTYPEVTLSIKQCVMSKFQAKWYKSQVEADRVKKGKIALHAINNNFYVKSRQRSNVAYPGGLVGTQGIGEMSAEHLVARLETYSAKMAALARKLAKGRLAFIYSGFSGYGGIKFVEKVLSAHGYASYAKDGEGWKRYAVWSGEQSLREKDAIRAVFNSEANDNGSKLQIVIGSPSIKEGVTLLRCRQVHVLEAYWNHSRLQQIYGRAVRYCSHKRLPAEERTVKIYVYAATTKRLSARDIARGPGPGVSIDLYMLWIADNKQRGCAVYTGALIECAADRYLWQEKKKTPKAAAST